MWNEFGGEFKREIILSGWSSESIMTRGMEIDMEEAGLQTLMQIKAFPEEAVEVTFRIPKAAYWTAVIWHIHAG